MFSLLEYLNSKATNNEFSVSVSGKLGSSAMPAFLLGLHQRISEAINHDTKGGIIFIMIEMFVFPPLVF